VPWFPDFANAAELARRSIRAEGQADPVASYLAALVHGDADRLTTAWPGGVVVHDPRAGEVHGHHELKRFIQQSQRWLDDHHARIEIVATTAVEGRAVVEMSASLDGAYEEIWPVAVVADAPDPTSVVFRTYCSQSPVDGRRHVRPPVLAADAAQPGGVVGRHLSALRAGDVDALVGTFAAAGYVQESRGSSRPRRGRDQIRSFYTDRLLDAGGAGIECCLETDDGVRCAVEFNCDSWGSRPIPPQAGIAVFERNADGLLVAARLYDDIEVPLAEA
jgi:hypothetical protein